MNERELTVKRMKKEVKYIYYVKKNEETQFDCTMYNVGIKNPWEKEEVEDFSPSYEEAVGFCNYLYENQVVPKNIFLMGEEFILRENI